MKKNFLYQGILFVFCACLIVCSSCTLLNSPYKPLSQNEKDNLVRLVVFKIQEAPRKLRKKPSNGRYRLGYISGRREVKDENGRTYSYDSDYMKDTYEYEEKERKRYALRLNATEDFIARLNERSEVTRYHCQILEFDTAPHIVLHIEDGMGTRFRNEEEMYKVYWDIDNKKKQAFEIVRAMGPIIYENKDLKIEDIVFTGKATYVNAYGKTSDTCQIFEYHFPVDRANKVENWDDADLSYLVQERYDIMHLRY
jgi:hypothetical protein